MASFLSGGVIIGCTAVLVGLESWFLRSRGVYRGLIRLFLSLTALGGIAIALDISHLVQVPVIAVTAWTLILPVVLMYFCGPLVTGATLMLIHPYRVGDHIHADVNGVAVDGTVIDMDLHYTWIRNADGSGESLVPNAGLAQVVVFLPKKEQ